MGRVQHSSDQVKNYEHAIEAFHSDAGLDYPTAKYYWLCWKGCVQSVTHQNTNTMLSHGLIQWLGKLDERQLKNTPDLQQLLGEITRKQLLPSMLNCVLSYPQPGFLKAHHLTWLCDNSLNAALNDATLYPLIIKLSSWSWLENHMTKNKPENYELLKAALGNKDYLVNINANGKNQLAFLATLETNKFTPQQILGLIHSVKDEKINSLLIIHLLCQEAYLKRLKGTSLLSRLSNKESCSPSRLNALVQHLDVSVLTEAVIDKLPPETAISIFVPYLYFLI